jgi:hypothetical protein
LAGKPRFCLHSENQAHYNDAAFVPEFSEGNNGSSFLEWKWTAGLMSRLDAEVELQTRSLKMDVRFEIPLGLARSTVRSSLRPYRLDSTFITLIAAATADLLDQ